MASSYHGKQNNNYLFIRKVPTKKTSEKLNTSTSQPEKEKSIYSFSKRKSSVNKEKEYISKYQNVNILSDEDYQKLSNEHEKLINQILDEEKAFRNLHKEHIDDMANLIKEEISGEREVDNPQSDLEAYVDSLSDVFKKEIEKITLLYNRLGKFKNMLKDQEVLAAKFGNQSESRYISNNTQNDNLNKTNVPNGEINLADLDESC